MKRLTAWRLVLIVLLLGLFYQSLIMQSTTVSYAEFKRKVAGKQVQNCLIEEAVIVGQFRPDQGQETGKTFRTVRVEDPQLVSDLQAAEVDFTGVQASWLMNLLFSWVIPLGLLLLFWSYFFRTGSPSGGLMGIGKSRARLVADRVTGVDFTDVAGCEEAKSELREVVDFLQNPTRYHELGARIPKGVLLLGPPGTGKTLLARAVAGEARVPFYSLSGSEFVEMFVGVGASRVRDLFEQAKKTAPCIIFIDELDAVGRERGLRMGVVNDEREQTLNQLLVEMDGFEPNTGVILLAATNRPEVLDRALLRPGRFDRRVVLDAPDLEGRLAILKVHSKGKPLDSQVDLRVIARVTSGFSGADLANTMNEAALTAARLGLKIVSQAHLLEAVEKIVAGPERKTRRLSGAEKERVAYHEAGHALVAAHSDSSDPVQKVSIVPRGLSALGYTMQLPREDQYLTTRGELLARIRVLLAGLAAEELVFEESSSGAEDDLRRATSLARQMVCLFGMSEAVGLGQCARRESQFLNPDGTFARDCSEQTAFLVDSEVRLLLERAKKEASEILQSHRPQMEAMVERLLESETLEGEELVSLLG